MEVALIPSVAWRSTAISRGGPMALRPRLTTGLPLSRKNKLGGLGTPLSPFAQELAPYPRKVMPDPLSNRRRGKMGRIGQTSSHSPGLPTSCNRSSQGEPRTTSYTQYCRGTGSRHPRSQPHSAVTSLPCRRVATSINHSRGESAPLTFREQLQQVSLVPKPEVGIPSACRIPARALANRC